MALLSGVGISYAQNNTEEVVEVPPDSLQQKQPSIQLSYQA